MDLQYEPIRRLLDRVRTRHRAIALGNSVVRGALLASAVIGLSLAAASVASLAARSPLTLAAIAVVALLLAGAALVWALAPLRHRPSDLRVARFVEERVPSLDDRLATAVDVFTSGTYETSRVLAEPLVNDAARRAEAVDVDDVVAPAQLRRTGLAAAASMLVLLVVVFMAKDPARQSLDAASLALFPARVRLEVLPGDARVKEGTTLSIEARLVGNVAPVATRLEIENGSAPPGVVQAIRPAWVSSEMAADSTGRFRATIPSLTRDVRYRVVAGSVTSPVYRVSVSAPPRIARIEADYTYPRSLGLAPRKDVDAGDIYAPTGTDVELHIYTERPVDRGSLALSGGQSVPLVSASGIELTTSMKVSVDGSYRVVLVDRDGVTNGAGTEYFIRTVDDRPPDVHITKPAADRQVTALEEVDVEAQADDDYGLERVELVYAVRGAAEKVVPLPIPARATNATVRHTISLEDLGVKPGDFVSYYVRARDVTRGPRSNEGRSDIFFLEVRPFEQEFSLAESQSMAGSGYNGSIDDLVVAQKQIVVATWKIDTRSARAFALPAQDIRAIGRSESDLQTRVAEVASSLRESTMRDPRSRLSRGGIAPMPEEAAMTAAVDAMARAVAALDSLKTGAALPPEMQALNALLEAQALVKKRQISRQQSAQGGPGNNNRNYDISTLFDKDLQRLQETNYESRQAGPPARPDALAEKLKELARRQDELLRREQELQNLPDAERKRELETLTREQAELREQAEDLAKSTRNSSSPNATSQMKDIARDMQGATNDLRRQDPKSSESRGRQALEKLKKLTQPDEKGTNKDPSAGRLQDALAKARDLRDKLDALTREIQQNGTNADRKRLQQDAARQLQQTRDLIDQLRREEPSLSSGGPGFTYEGQGMTLSAPGTEAFKQDFARWQELRDQATRALDRMTAAITKRLGEKGRSDRLAAGVDDKAPAAYRAQVDAYFKAIAGRKSQ